MLAVRLYTSTLESMADKANIVAQSLTVLKYRGRKRLKYRTLLNKNILKSKIKTRMPEKSEGYFETFVSL